MLAHIPGVPTGQSKVQDHLQLHIKFPPLPTGESNRIWQSENMPQCGPMMLAKEKLT